MPPKHILNAPTRLMKDLGYGRGYEYDHEAPEAFSGQNYFPDDLERRHFYEPSDRGFEREIAARLAHWENERRERTLYDRSGRGRRRRIRGGFRRTRRTSRRACCGDGERSRHAS